MILATHALAGAAIGKTIGNPWLIIPTSIIVHFAMDSFRHGEYFNDQTVTVKEMVWKVSIDLATGISIISLSVHIGGFKIEEIINILTGSVFCLFPDLLTLFNWKFPKNKILAGIKKFHAFSHRYGKFSKYSPERQWKLRNALNDILFSLLAVIILLFA